MSDSLQPHVLQHAGLPCPSPTPGLPVHHQLPKPIQTNVYHVGDTIQPSHPLSSPSPSAFNLSQHQGLFQWVSSSHHVAKVLKFQLQSFQWIFRMDFLYDGLVGSPSCPRDSQESSPAPQLESIDSLALSLLYSRSCTVFINTAKFTSSVRKMSHLSVPTSILYYIKHCY